MDSDRSNAYWMTAHTFLKPDTLFLGDAEKGPAGVVAAEALKSLPVSVCML